MQHVKHCGMCCRFLDGRVWPQEDEKQVKLMMAMIHHCTGVSENPGSAALTTHCSSAPVMHSSCAVSSDDTDSQHLIETTSSAAGVRLKAWFRPKAEADEKGMLK